MESSLITTFLVVFREALEASLIVGIILTLLAKMNQKRYFPQVIFSCILAVGASLLGGMAMVALTDSAKEEMEKLIEGGVSLAACGVLTYMIFWMDRQAKKIRTDIETRMEQAISGGEYLTLMALPFLAIFREGAETVLFLYAVAIQNSGIVSLGGGFLGFFLAVAVTAAIFIGGKRIPLKPLFQTSGGLLLLIAAGLLAYGIHEFQEIGLLPEIYAPVWDINHILNEKKGVGALLKSLFGYNGNPSLLEVLSYGLYLSVIYWLLTRRKPELRSV